MKIEDVGLLKFGNTVQLIGGVWAGEGRAYLCLFPEDAKEFVRVDHERGVFISDSGDANRAGHNDLEVRLLEMDDADWERFLRQTDIMETEILTRNKDGVLAKAVMRKSARQIDQATSWKVFRRDGYACRYCGRDDVPLTVDHAVLWEDGGPSTEQNLVSACRKCNKTRGNTSYAEWLSSPYYKNVSSSLSPEVLERNRLLAETLHGIPRKVYVQSR